MDARLTRPRITIVATGAVLVAMLVTAVVVFAQGDAGSSFTVNPGNVTVRVLNNSAATDVVGFEFTPSAGTNVTSASGGTGSTCSTSSCTWSPGKAPGQRAIVTLQTTGSDPSSFDITVHYSDGSTQVLTANPCPTITVSPTTLASGTVGSAYSQQISASGGAGPHKFSVGGAPPSGVSLSADGLLSGTPTQGGSFSFDVIAMDTNGCIGSRHYTVTINDAPTQGGGGTPGGQQPDIAAPDLHIAKRILTPEPIEERDLVEFVIEVVNLGETTARGVRVNDYLVEGAASGVIVEKAIQDQRELGADLPRGCVFDPTGPKIKCDVGDVEPNSIKRIVYSLRPKRGGRFTNYAFNLDASARIEFVVRSKDAVLGLSSAAASVNSKGIGKVAAECLEGKNAVCKATLSVFQSASSQQSTGATVSRRARKRKRRARALGTVKGRIRGRRTGRLRIALNRTGRRQLRKSRTMTVRLRGYSKNRRGKRRKVDTELILNLRARRR